MRTIGPHRLATVFVGASLTLLTISFVAPSTALAGCVHPADRPTIGGDLMRLDLDGRKSDPAPAPKPCTGAFCPGNSSPLSTSAPSVTPEPESQAMLVGICPVERPGSWARTRESLDGRPILDPTSIFHPPRFSF